MTTTCLQFAVMWLLAGSGVATAQAPQPRAADVAPARSSSEDVNASSPEDAARQPPALSLDRLDKVLTTPAPIRHGLEERPTFRIRVEERERFIKLLRDADLEKPDTRPAPPGGVYGYEQQRLALAAIDRSGTRMEPYAAFNGGELITLAVQGLVSKYLIGRAVDAIAGPDPARAAAEAREEVARSIREYCAAPPEGADIRMCTEPVVVR